MTSRKSAARTADKLSSHDAAPHGDRRLVLTADDFGYDRATDALILDLVDRGAVTATTVLAVSPTWASAAPGLLTRGATCGLHMATTSDAGHEAWSPRSTAAAATLTEPDGTLPTDPTLAEQRSIPSVILAEMTAQYQALTAAGVKPVRLDSHSGTLYGLRGADVLPAVLGFCAEHGLGFRLPRSVELYLGDEVPAQVAELHARAIEAADVLGVALPAAMGTNTVPPDRVRDYGSLKASYLDLLSRLPEGTSEIFLHPGADTPWARERFGHSWDKRVWEARLLRDPQWRAALDREGIVLVDRW